MENYKKIHLPSTEKEVKKLQATWLGLLVYDAIRADLTTPSTNALPCVITIDGLELVHFEVSPPGLAGALCRLGEAYCEVAYNTCDINAWRHWATVQSEALSKLSKLTAQEKVDQELATIHTLAGGEQAYALANAVFPLVSQLAGEESPPLVSPSPEELKEFFGPYIEHSYQSFGDEDIKETIDSLTWLTNEAGDEDVRLFVSAKCAYGCLMMASLVSKLVNIATAIGMGKEPSPLELVKQATTNPITEAVLELASAFQGLGGDSNEATGKLWDAGIHPLAKKVSWQEIQQPHIVENRFVISEAVHDAVCHLIDTVQQYTSRVTFSDILLKARSSHLLNSIKKASWNKRIDEGRKARKKPDEIALDEAKKTLGLSYEDMTDERIVEEILRRRQKKSGQPLVVDDMSAEVENRVLLEQMANEPSLTLHEKQVLVLMTAKVEDGRVPTLEEIGQQMSITKVRVKQLLDSATSKLQGYNPFT